jgi:hypothetical protein
MFGLSSTALSGIIGGAGGFVFKLIGQQAEMKAAEKKHQMELMAMQSENYFKSLDKEIELIKTKAEFEERVSSLDPFRAVTRRFIALGLLGLLAFLPLYVIFGNLDWIFMFEQKESSGFWIFKTTDIVHQIVTKTGLPVEWLFGVSEAFALVVSFYFGGSAAQVTNPYSKK